MAQFKEFRQMVQRRTTQQTVTLRGASGESYVFHVYPLGQSFTDTRPAIYSFALVGVSVSPKYIGETGNLKNRGLHNHEELPCARRHDANRTLVMIAPEDVTKRRAIERDLIKAYSPPCNDRL